MRIIAIVISLLPVVAVASSIDLPRGDARRGANKYHDYGCILCHGAIGQASAFDNPVLDPAMPFDVLRTKLRNKSGIMPAFSEKVLTEEDIKDIYAFIQAFPR